MNNELCLFCLEDMNCTEILGKPSHCACKVLLHQSCMRLIEDTGLLCPICRIKKSPNIRIIITENDNSYLLLFANKVFDYFEANPNVFRFIVFLCTSLIVTIALIPQLVRIGLTEPTYRMKTLVFVGISSIVIFEIFKKIIISLY